MSFSVSPCETDEPDDVKLTQRLIAAGVLILEDPRWRTAALLAIAVWSFCRAYYFAFYVIEHYVDPGYRFAGLWSFARYVMRGRGEGRG